MRLLILFTLFVVAAASAPPNLVFVMVDDLGPEWVSAYGADDIETPNIDQLAAAGLLFENAYSMPQCTPTRVTLLTGQYPFRHGWTNHWDVPRWGAGAHFDAEKNFSFPRALRDAGYATAIAGKWQINDFRVQPEALKDHGFDEWCVWTGYESQNPPSAERYWDPYIYRSDRGSQTYEGKFGPDLYNEFLVDFVARHKDEPMFVYYPMALTHGPLVPTPRELLVREKMPMHRAMVKYTDFLVGNLVAAFEKAGLWENTILIFTTDNGTSSGIRGRMGGRMIQGGKGKLTENGPRQPFIAYGPGHVPVGERTAALTDFSDLFPTFLELAGVEVPEGTVLDGKSIAAVILGESELGPREWMLAMGFGPARLDEKGVRPVHWFTDRVLRDWRYKVHVLDGSIARLHDLAEDPAEEVNLLASTEPAHLAAMRKFGELVAVMPRLDARPRYTRLPPQPWDVTIAEMESKIKK